MIKLKCQQTEPDLEIHTFRLRFEGAADIALETSGYWCDAGGRLIEGGDTINGRLLLALTAPELERGRLLIVPMSAEAFRASRIMAEDLLAYDAFEPQTRFDPGLRYHLLPEVPETLWRFWFIYRRFASRRAKSARTAIRSW
ncbi:hypothetical protein ACWJKU_18545 [Methylocaldum sp. MU1018]